MKSYYDCFKDEYINENELDICAPPERYVELNEDLLIKNAARWICETLFGKRRKMKEKNHE